MITIYDDATLAAAFNSDTDRDLAALLDRSVHDAKASGLWDLTCIIVIEPDDSAGDIEGVLGFNPLIGPLESKAGQFMPWWNWLEHHPGFFELLHTVGDEGFAYFLFVPDVGLDRTGLAALCRTYEFD